MSGRSQMALVAAFVALGTALRCWRLDLGWFGVDQARDVQTALDVAAGHAWPLVGPTMRRVTSLGALYYYFWALPYLVSRNPLAAYVFAAGLGVVTLPLTWGLARRSFGGRAALVALAVLATSRIAVIDARVAWAPAALPAVALVVLWLLVGPSTAARMALLGAVLGVAVQLHLSMVAWALAAAIVVLLRRPGSRSLAAGIVGFACTAWPAAYAVLANAGRDAGIASLPSRGPLPDLPHLLDRLHATIALAWRVPAAFETAAGGWQVATRLAAMLIAAAGALGVVRLAGATLRGHRVAATLLATLLFQLGVVVLLPGEAWYYYLDAALPLWALAAGALVAATPAAPRIDRMLALVAVPVVVAALVQGLASARWIETVGDQGFMVLNPTALTLDGGGGRDAAVPGRLVTVGVKRALASVLAAEPASLATRWQSTHGPAFDDAMGDNGFWLAQVSAETTVGPVAHATIWHRDDPDAPVAPAPGFELVTIGSLVVARYTPTIAYDTCRDAHGPVTVPARIVPDPRRYGDGTVARPTSLPRRVECTLAAGTGATRVVAAVTAGTVSVQDGAGTSGPAARTSSLCVRRGAQPATFAIEIAEVAGTPSDLDLYERPDPDCAAIKIAP